MNKLDELLERVVSRHAANLGLSQRNIDQMVKEISMCVQQGYNSRAEIIQLVKKEIAA